MVNHTQQKKHKNTQVCVVRNSVYALELCNISGALMAEGTDQRKLQTSNYRAQNGPFLTEHY